MVKASDDAFFLDLFPAEDDTHLVNPYYALHFLPLHRFMRVRQVGSTLELADVDHDWLQRFLGEHPEAIAHEMVEDRIILTASSSTLQDFLVKHIYTEGAFSQTDTLRPLSLEQTDQ